jgi:beta-galactosidase
MVPMNRCWRFSPKVVEGDTSREFDDTTFMRVVIPHTNKVLPWHSFDDKEYEFISTYRRHFKLPRGSRGQRVFVDFEAAMTASTVWINGHSLGEYQGGYTPFSFELTEHVDWAGDNVIAVHVDSTERNDIPPFGYEIDYLTFGGIYREVNLRIVPTLYIENMVARAVDPLTDRPSLEVECFFDSRVAIDPRRYSWRVELRDGDKVLAKEDVLLEVPSRQARSGSQMITLKKLDSIQLWDLKHPRLYSVHVHLMDGDALSDKDSRRVGFR